jgi:hypothetical protein
VGVEALEGLCVEPVSNYVLKTQNAQKEENSLALSRESIQRGNPLP